MIHVLIADDHKIFLDGLESGLKTEPDINVVATCLNGNYAISAIGSIMNSADRTIDVAVLDINMPDQDGIEVTKYIKANFPSIKVLMLTMYKKAEFIKKLMQAGVDGYMLKESGIDEFITAVRNLYQGKSFFSQAVVNMVMSDLGRLEQREEAIITDREKEIITQIGLGHTTPEISKILKIAPNTVDTHRRNILSKLNLRNSYQLVRYAIFNGYVPNPKDQDS